MRCLLEPSMPESSAAFRAAATYDRMTAAFGKRCILSGIKQPALGILASVLIMAIALGFISLFDFPRFSGWISYVIMCLIPMEVMASVIWGSAQPGYVARSSQPLRGILLLLTCAAVGAVVAALQFYTVGASVSPPAPMLVMWAIVAVAMTFWGAIMFGGWPFTSIIKSPVAAGFTMLLVCYALNYVLFRVFFNYEFMKGAPVYVASLDPHGLFNAWGALSCYVSVLGVLFLVINFDLWPFATSPALMKQPVLGILWLILSLVIGGGAYYVGVNMMGMDPVAFMVKVPIPFIFGTIIMLNMLHNSIFAKLTQPLKGGLNTVASAVIGWALATMYSALAPAVTGALKQGPPAYEQEIWLASALLAVTFPFLVAYAEFLKMWPLQRATAEKAVGVGSAN